MRYFLVYSSFTSETPFDASLFIEIRKRLGPDTVNLINEKIVKLRAGFHTTASENNHDDSASGDAGSTPNKERVLNDTTAYLQDIAYPTVLNLLNNASEKTEEQIGKIFAPQMHDLNPRNYSTSRPKEISEISTE